MAKKKILVIDDDADFRASVRPLLEKEGFVVVEASSGKDGLDKLVEHEPDLIILDVMMETMEEGYGVNQAVKYQDRYEVYRQVPIIMVSSIMETPLERYPYAEEVDMIRPNVYLTKPLDIGRFLDVVRRLAHVPSAT
ncbi:MAG: response regulator [Gemmatimonadales bacterium]|nr:response regulator [Gemmatimonadales bacterium]